MKREISLEEISDGKLYGSGDMVKVGCDDCRGCSACCRGMGSSIVLDPYDVFRLETGLGLSFEGLLAEAVELNLVDGIILPNLKMSGEGEACTFLNEEGRCRIHPFRPGICRMFPLGRIYEDHGFRYFNQIHECRKEQKTKVKIRKWMDTPDMGRYESYIVEWHYFLKELEERLEQKPEQKQEQKQEEGSETTGGEDARKRTAMGVLKLFYLIPFQKELDFYQQFEARMAAAREEFINFL